MPDRRNHVFEQLGRTFRKRSEDVVDAVLPSDMLSLVLELANPKPGSPDPSSDHCQPRRSTTASWRAAIPELSQHFLGRGMEGPLDCTISPGSAWLPAL